MVENQSNEKSGPGLGLRVVLGGVFRINDTFNNNLKIKHRFTKYFERSCRYCSD